MKTLKITNPADGSPLAEVPADDAASVAAKAERARRAQPAWQATPLAKRAISIARFRLAVATELETLAKTLTQEVGKPLAQSRNELNGFLAASTSSSPRSRRRRRTRRSSAKAA
jgi:acyl-CoA reductase-like NAD-dependent aldehyde dehydrogenase